MVCHDQDHISWTPTTRHPFVLSATHSADCCFACGTLASFVLLFWLWFTMPSAQLLLLCWMGVVSVLVSVRKCGCADGCVREFVLNKEQYICIGKKRQRERESAAFGPHNKFYFIPVEHYPLFKWSFVQRFFSFQPSTHKSVINAHYTHGFEFP